MDDVKDTNRLMSEYSSGIANVLIRGCFHGNLEVSKNPHLTAKIPYKPTDDNRVLHQHLAVHNRHVIPIGFYY